MSATPPYPLEISYEKLKQQQQKVYYSTCIQPTYSSSISSVALG